MLDFVRYSTLLLPKLKERAEIKGKLGICVRKCKRIILDIKLDALQKLDAEEKRISHIAKTLMLAMSIVGTLCDKDKKT